MSDPIVLVDMDGPLAAFDRQCFDHCAAEGWPLDVAGEHEQSARYMTDHVVDRGHRNALRRVIDSPGWFRSLPVTEGAQAGMAALRGVAEVWVCSKPLEANPTGRDEKAAWLAEHFPGLERRLILAPDKSLIRGSVLLDDAPKPEWFGRAEWRPVIFMAPYNCDGSAWADLWHWTWGEPLIDLLAGGEWP